MDLQVNVSNVGDLNSLTQNGMPGIYAKRPWVEKDGNTYINAYINGELKAKQIQTNAGVLRREEWMALDSALLPIAESRLGAVGIIRSKGLVYNVPNGMGSTVLEYHDVSDALEATTTMDGITRSKGDRLLFNANYLPLPITHVDYEMNMRVLSASRSLGRPLDTLLAERAARRIMETTENMLVTDTSYTYGGGTIYSLLNQTDINDKTITSWTGSAKTAAGILTDVREMKQDAIDAKYFGPYTLMIPSTYETTLDEDYDTQTPGTTIRERILKIAKIDDIVVVDSLPDDHVLLVQMTSDVVRMVDAMPMQNVQWENEGGLNLKFKVMTIQVPQIRSDYNGASGIVHATIAG